jgi:uncharacterized damage-inducible protein DinB
VKELLLQLAIYNEWANQRLSESILSLPEETLTSVVPSSFNSIHATLLHMWDAENIWWQRLKLQENIIRPSERFNGTTIDISASLLHQNRLWKDWVMQASQNALDHVFLYYNTKKEAFKQPVYQMLLHMFNHGSYHRGQLVNMLRQLNVTKIPSTDFIVWSRTRK